jgi:tetratricopeptide (TPR) repeat protein
MDRFALYALGAAAALLCVLVLLQPALAEGDNSMSNEATAAFPDFDALWDYSDPAATEKKFQEVLAQTHDSAPLQYVAQLYTQIARCYGLRGDFAGADVWLGKAEASIDSAGAGGGDMRLPRVRLLLERGRRLNSSGSPADSLPLFKEAAQLAESIGETGYAMDALHMLGIAEPGEAGLEWNLKAIALAESSSDERARKWLGALYNNTGWAYQESGRPEQALALFEKGAEFRRISGKQPYLRLAEYAVGRALRDLGRHDEALAIQERLLAEYEAEDSDDGYVHEELAELYLLAGREDEAKGQFIRAYEVLSQDSWMVKDQAERLARLKQLAGL